ncbi:hypothetical protein OG698_08805 [Streptomyces sp. NBC_01003]|uniref:hypothetical protein n=1 Tax=Streptomyces sp. NBC_01003 TaxID=2903714 RepID=UPI003866F79D|nr:hypothetical protein OG698_08805 [Streptomyces sp. NBC_01003]
MKSCWPQLWLAVHRRRRMLVALVIGMVVFEALIVVVANTVPPGQLFSGNPFHYYTSGDALAQSYVLWPQLGVLVGVGVLGILAAYILLMRRNLAP